MSVREYKEKFNRLRRYVGKELEEETVQIRRFVRGLRVELRTYCLVGHFQTVSELVERMDMVETNLAEEAKPKSRSHASSGKMWQDGSLSSGLSRAETRPRTGLEWGRYQRMSPSWKGRTFQTRMSQNPSRTGEGPR